MGWDKISDMKISNNSQLVAGSCMSNFVSIYEIDLDSYLNSSTSEEAGAYVPSVDKRDDRKDDSCAPTVISTSGKANKPSGAIASKSRHSSSNANLPYAEAQSKMTSASAKESAPQQGLRMPIEATSPINNAKRSNSLTNLRSDALDTDEPSIVVQSPPEVIWDSARYWNRVEEHVHTALCWFLFCFFSMMYLVLRAIWPLQWGNHFGSDLKKVSSK